MQYFTFAILLLSVSALFGQMDDQSAKRVALAERITVSDLKAHLEILAADDMEGRETGEPGQKKAAAYLAAYFESLGLPKIGYNDSYYQPIGFSREGWASIEWKINGQKMRHLREFYSIPRQNESRTRQLTNEIQFLGFGIETEDYSDYDRANSLEGSTILILDGEPLDQAGVSLLSGTKTPSEWTTDYERKLEVAAAKGVSTVIFVKSNFRESMAQQRKEILNNRLEIMDPTAEKAPLANAVFISPETARKILGKDYRAVVKARKKIVKSGKLKPVRLSVRSELLQEKSSSSLIGENVLGFVEGSDPVQKEEVVVVTAHYDHIGRRGKAVFNGADDNGSGTSTILEVTEAFVEAKNAGNGPKRSVLFMLVSGEEKGLLGSQYYVNNPLFPLEQTVANVNVDMVGRVDEAHADDPYYIYVIGSDRLSTELHNINETANQRYTQLELDYTYNAEDDPNRYYYRSDHYNFAREGIPAIFYFNGTHPDYHRDTDTIEKINFDKMERIGRLVFHTVWDLANRPERIKVDVKQK